jgi:hypothetical protein
MNIRSRRETEAIAGAKSAIGVAAEAGIRNISIGTQQGLKQKQKQKEEQEYCITRRRSKKRSRRRSTRGAEAISEAGA